MCWVGDIAKSLYLRIFRIRPYLLKIRTIAYNVYYVK
jgi:hypothetical protein